MWTVERTARAGGGLALMVSALLAVLALPTGVDLLRLAPATGGGALALLRPSSPPLLVLAGVAMAASAVWFLIGGAGLMYLPSIVLTLVAAWQAATARRLS